LHEAGIDAGGLGRELFAAAALELISPTSGLVIPVPNSRNGVGNFQDCVLPFPAHWVVEALSQYRCAGVLLGMCIRSGIVQPFVFPPLVWRFLAGEALTIERVFEIDDRYRALVETLRDAQTTLEEREFAARFSLFFVITNAMGNEVPLTPRGAGEPVTLANCGAFITMANEYRLKEIRGPLEKMKDGLWENLRMSPSYSVDWETLEFAACGEPQISIEALRKGTRFERISEPQTAMFWKVVESLTTVEISGLLKFATGRIRLPPTLGDGDVFLRVDSLDGIDRLPKATTCSQTLHYPTYSSFEKARQLLLVAINFAGSFELR
jgi:hypothetical protein